MAPSAYCSGVFQVLAFIVSFHSFTQQLGLLGMPDRKRANREESYVHKIAEII